MKRSLIGFDIPIKILVMGKSGTGKTAFMKRISTKLNYDIKPPPHMPTIGYGYQRYIMGYKDKIYSIRLFEIPGIRQFDLLPKDIFQNIKGLMYMYSKTDQSSFQDLKYWANFSINNVNNYDEISQVVIGTKADLIQKYEVSNEDIEGYMKENRELNTNFECTLFDKHAMINNFNNACKLVIDMEQANIQNI